MTPCPLSRTEDRRWNPACVKGINATTVLVRRVKQGKAKWFRLQLKEKLGKLAGGSRGRGGLSVGGVTVRAWLISQ